MARTSDGGSTVLGAQWRDSGWRASLFPLIEGPTEVVTTPDGRVLAFCRWGAPDGAPLFLLHGTPGSRLLRHVGDGYHRNGLCVYTYDRPGYGLSTRQPGRRVVDAAVDVRAIAEAVGVDVFGIVGVSGGAAAALGCAALLRGQVTRCATVVGAAPINAEGLDFAAGMSDESRRDWTLGLQGVDALEEEWLHIVEWIVGGLPGLELRDPERAMLVAAFGEATRQGSGGFVDDSLALVRDWGFAVDAVRAPTRVMMARADGIPGAHGDWLVRRLANAELLWVDGGHFGPRDEPEMDLMTWVGHGGPNP